MPDGPEKNANIVRFKHPSNRDSINSQLRLARNGVADKLGLGSTERVPTTNVRTQAPSRPRGKIYLIWDNSYTPVEKGHKINTLNKKGFLVQELGKSNPENSPA